MSEDRKHHNYSPSTLQSLEACPCFQSRSDVVNERAIAGTLAHSVVESRKDDARLSDDDAIAAVECMEFYDRRLMLARRMETETAKVIELKEAYLPIDNVVWKEGEEEIKGTTAGYIDAAIIAPDRAYAEIMDFKFGAWSVTEASNNLQGLAYALGLMRAYPTLQSVRYFFIQPYTKGFTSHVVARADLPQHYLRIQIIVEKARAARAAGQFTDARPMTPNCSFCANIGKCPAVAEFACRVGRKFHPLGIPENVTPSALQDPQQTRLGLELAAVLAVWSSAFRSQISDRVIRGGQPVPDGFEIVQRTERAVCDPAKFREVALKHVSPEVYAAACKPPPFGPLEEAVSEAAPRGSKTAAVTAFREALVAEGAVKPGESYSFLKAVPK